VAGTHRAGNRWNQSSRGASRPPGATLGADANSSFEDHPTFGANRTIHGISTFYAYATICASRPTNAKGSHAARQPAA
jgi:hypothetical protein